jgi:hypothetical protein
MKKGIEKKLTKHHILPRSRGGVLNPGNILFLKREKHDVWHKLFKDMTIEEAISLLQRTQRMKESLMKNGY